jgi:hypothetical protein
LILTIRSTPRQGRDSLALFNTLHHFVSWQQPKLAQALSEQFLREPPNTSFSLCSKTTMVAFFNTSFFCFFFMVCFFGVMNKKIGVSHSGREYINGKHQVRYSSIFS